MWSGCENVVWTQENEKGRQKEKLKNGELPHTTSDGIYQINTPCLARLFQFLILFSVIAIFLGEQNYSAILMCDHSNNTAI